MKDSEQSKHHEHSEEFYTQEEMQEIFVKGINMIKKKATSTRSANPSELWNLTNECLNGLNGKITESQISAVEAA